MRKNLTKANQLIHNIQNNLNNPKQLRDFCAQLEDLTQYIQPQTKYHYMLFLAEIYASKLREFRIAQTICRQIIQDRRPSVQLEGNLRLSFINALQHKYHHATKNLQQADTLSEKKQELQAIFIDFCHRLFVYSKECNLLHGLKCQSQQKYEQAMNFYKIEYQSQVLAGQIENQYFAAKAIIQLASIFPNFNFRGVDPKKCKQFLKELYQEKQQRDDLSVLQKLDQNYKLQKAYLTKIVELLKKKEESIKTVKGFTKSKTNIFYSQLNQKKLLAIYKLKKVMRTQPDLSPILRKQFQKCLQQLQQNRVNNYSMLNQFTAVQNNKINQINQMIRLNDFKNGFNALKSLMGGEDFQKEKPKKRNRFVNHPSFQVASPKALRSPLIYDGQRDQKIIKIQPTMSETVQDQIANDNFQGSYMEKINETSNGYEKRYFYFVKSQLEKRKFKLYYTTKPSKVSNDDLYYDLKNINKILEGKKTKALQRSQCSKFQDQRCFSIIYQNDKSKNFYVPDPKDYRNWIALFNNYEQKLTQKSPLKDSKMGQSLKKTVLMD